MDNNTQTRLRLTPLMEAAIDIVRDGLLEKESNLFDGIIDAFRTEAREITASLTELAPVERVYEFSTLQSPLSEYKATLMKIVQDKLDEDPFCDATEPEQVLLYSLNELRLKSQAYEIEKYNRQELEKTISADRAKIAIQSVDAEFRKMHPAQPEAKPSPLLNDEWEPKEVEEPKGPKPVLKKVDGRRKPEPDLGLSDLAKIFNQKGVPGLGEIKKHLPQVARHIFGDGIDSIPNIAKQIKASLSDTAALAKVAHACKDSSGTASSEEFMSALSEVSK